MKTTVLMIEVERPDGISEDFMVKELRRQWIDEPSDDFDPLMRANGEAGGVVQIVAMTVDATK